MRIYELIIDFTEELSGVNAISIVSKPAMESSFVALKDQIKKIKLEAIDDERQILLGAALIPNKPIFRNDDDGTGDYYVFMSEATVRQAAELFQEKGFQNEITEEHEISLTGNTVIETWIKEHKLHDKSVKFGIDAPVGTWFVSMKINDKKVYKKAKKGELTGFSIEGYFADKFSKITSKQNQKSYNNMNKKDFLKKILAIGQKKVKLMTWTLEDGETVIEAEAFEAKKSVFVVNGDEHIPLPVGEFKTKDNATVIVTEEGVINEIKAAGKEKDEDETGSEFVTKGDFNKAIADIKSELTLKKEEDPKKDEDVTKEKNLELQKKVVELADVQKKAVALQKKVVDLQKELDEKPDAEKIKHADHEQKIDLSLLDSKGRLQYFVNSKN